MNKIYRTVYNESTGTWIAVSELGKGNMPASGSGVSARGASWVLRPLVMAMGMVFGGLGSAYAQNNAYCVDSANKGSDGSLNYTIGSATNGTVCGVGAMLG